MADLKPCPFCGQSPVREDANEVTHIYCDTEDCLGPTVTMHSSLTAVAMWNRRAPDGVPGAGKTASEKE